MAEVLRSRGWASPSRDPSYTSAISYRQDQSPKNAQQTHANKAPSGLHIDTSRAMTTPYGSRGHDLLCGDSTSPLTTTHSAPAQLSQRRSRSRGAMNKTTKQSQNASRRRTMAGHEFAQPEWAASLPGITEDRNAAHSAIETNFFVVDERGHKLRLWPGTNCFDVGEEDEESVQSSAGSSGLGHGHDVAGEQQQQQQCVTIKDDQGNRLRLWLGTNYVEIVDGEEDGAGEVVAVSILEA